MISYGAQQISRKMMNRILKEIKEMWDVSPLAAIILVPAFAIAIAMIATLPFALYQLATSETISLTKSEWVCMDTKVVSTTQIIPQANGQNMIIPVTKSECVEYRRR